MFLPVRMMRRPVAKGSRVPVWPTLTLWPYLARKKPRTLATTPKLEMPAGLSMRMIWSSIVLEGLAVQLKSNIKVR